jgi:hypothetical protein
MASNQCEGGSLPKPGKAVQIVNWLQTQSFALSLFSPSLRRTRPTVAGETPTCTAICLPSSAAGAAAQSPRPLPRVLADGADVAGMSDPTIRPILHGDIDQPNSERSGQTPAASATASGLCPLSICRTIRSRPRGVSWAFLCPFTRSSRESLKPRNSSFLGQDRVDNLFGWSDPRRSRRAALTLTPRGTICRLEIVPPALF